MSPNRTFIIVGAGLAGAKAAETLRAEGFDGRLLLLGDEPVRPYERPPMSKTYLRRESSFDDVAVHDADFYKTHEIELHTSAVVASLDVAASQVQLGGGARLGFDRLLLATGAVPRRPNIPGVELEGFHLLRTVADSDAIHDAVTVGAPVVIIGAGWIGSEVAASARQLGADVTMMDMASVPLERVLGPEVGGVYRDLHDGHGVKLRLGVGIEAIKGAGRVEEVRLTDGSVIPAGAVVAGIGVLPRTELAVDAGLQIDNGVLCDVHLATSAPGIYAAGDVASAWHRRTARPSASSTGQPPSTRARLLPRTCSTSPRRTKRCPTSTRTSTTSVWNTGVGRLPTTASSFEATRPVASSSRSAT